MTATSPTSVDHIFLAARSNTLFAPGSVDLDLIRKAYDLARWGPTANNSVPLRLVVASSEIARAAVVEHARPSNRANLDRAPLLLVVARDERYHDFVPAFAPGSDEARERLEADPVDRLRRAHENTLIQIGYLVVALRAVGLAVRPYGGFDKAGLDQALLEGSAWRSEVLLGVGFPTEGDTGAGVRRGRPTWDDAAMVL